MRIAAPIPSRACPGSGGSSPSDRTQGLISSFATAAELGRLLRRREISAVELTRHFLDRLAALGPRYNALAELTPNLALRQARRADRLLRGGDAASPLLGVPYGAKDLLATKGIPTRWGAPPSRDQVFDYDATVIRRLDEAGAVLVGKLAMVEMAGGGGYHFASASLHGPGLNPWNLSHWSGGSSSGSGSAVTAGLVPYALGSETWGSITTPAAYCGITGLRPTRGLVSRVGAMELAASMDKIGPMARSAEDCGWVLHVIAGGDPHDVWSADRGFRFAPRLRRERFRLGVLPLDYTDDPGDAATERAFEEALRVLRRMGLKIAKVSWPDQPLAEIARTVLAAETASVHEEFIKSARLEELVDAAQRDGLRRYLELPAATYIRTLRQRAAATRAVRSLFERFDALVAPALLGEAVTLETNLSQRFGNRRSGTSVLGAVAGVPCLVLPMGFGPSGLPLGLSLTGDIFSENTLLHIGTRYQRETDWHRRRPPPLPPA